MKVEWDGTDALVMAAMDAYGRKVIQAVRAVADYWAPILEAYAKEHAPWTDQTGHARQSLHAWAETLANETVELYLAHGVDYGIFLEVKEAGKWAILWPTIEAHLPEIEKMLKDIFQ